jgi:Tol biopolymer transport system component
MSLEPGHAEQRRLLVGAAIQPQEWSSEGNLVIERSEESGSALGIVNLASGTVEWVSPPRPGFGRASLSPDARWLAFDGSSNPDPSRMAVYVVGRSGGTPTAIAAGPTNSMLPTWTPDGRAVLFVSDRTGSPGLWMQPVADGRAAGDPQLLTQDLGRVANVWAMTPQGAYIYFRQTGLVRIATVPLDETGTVAGSPSELPTNQMGATMMPDWAPDGRRLVYQLRMTGAQSVTLGVMDLARSTETNLKTTLRAFNHPRWSPDGRQIVVKGGDIEGRHGVFVVDVTSGETTALKVVPANAEDPLAGVMWAPDGTLVAGDAQGYVRIDSHTGRTERLKGVTGAGSGFAISPVDQELALADVEDDTAVLRVVARGGVSREVLRGDKGERFVDLVWMPDGHNLLFVRGRTNTRLSSVRSAWRVDTRTGTAVPINLTIGGLRELAVTQDGRRLAFTYGTPTREPWIIEHFLPSSDGATVR